MAVWLDFGHDEHTHCAQTGVVMRLEKLAKDVDSKVSGCQTMYLAENGMFGVQGLEVDTDTLGNVESLLPGEGVVLIKPEIVIEAVCRYQAGR